MAPSSFLIHPVLSIGLGSPGQLVDGSHHRSFQVLDEDIGGQARHQDDQEQVLEKEKLFFMQFSPYLITFILLFVDPIGPRCFYIVYVFYAALAMMLLNYAVRKNGPIKDYGKYAALCVSGVYVFYYLFIYGSIFVCDQRRQEKAHAKDCG